MRLGIANLPILLGMRFLTRADLFLVMILKVFGQGLVNGTFASYVFLFSFSGSFTSFGAMLLVQHLCGSNVSFVGISLSGALASALMQIFLSLTLIFGQNARVIAPYFLGSGLLAGLVIGFIANGFALRSKWLAMVEKRYCYLLEREKGRQ